MDRRRLMMCAASLAALSLVGCGHAPKEVHQGSIVTSAQLRECIKKAGEARRWTVVKDEPGKMRLRYVKSHEHVLNVDVVYDDQGYQIVPVKEGSTLVDENGRVHRNVNQWIIRLSQSIKHEEEKLLLDGKKIK